jgi:hypothetical protein
LQALTGALIGFLWRSGVATEAGYRITFASLALVLLAALAYYSTIRDTSSRAVAARG